MPSPDDDGGARTGQGAGSTPRTPTPGPSADSEYMEKRRKAARPAEPSHHNTGRYILAPYILLIFCSLVILFASEARPELYPVMGGVCGLLSSSYVMVAYLFGPSKRRGPPLALLFWRSFCDFGLSIRFVASHAFAYLICGQPSCMINWTTSQQNLCAAPSSMFEFFEMASEAWFLCIAVDLLISISNPFSTFKSRMKYYHMFVWCTATIFALPVGVDHNIGGYWFIRGKHGVVVDKSVFCWLQVQDTPSGNLNWVPWAFFYVPLMVIYLLSACVLYFAYGRLKKGVSNTFVHRLRVLVINSINLSSCFLYWFILISVYASVYASASTDLSVAQALLKILQYLIPAKGVSGVTVWVLVMSIDIEGLGGEGFDNEDNMIDLNSALRQEVLLYSQGGIQVCALHMAEKPEYFQNRDKLTTYLSHGLHSPQGHDDTFTPWFFLRLIFGFQEQIDKVASLMAKKDIKMTSALQKKRHSLTENPTTKDFGDDSDNLSTERDSRDDDEGDEGDDRYSSSSTPPQNRDKRDVRDSSDRLSQRPTLAMTHSDRPPSTNLKAHHLEDMHRGVVGTPISPASSADNSSPSHHNDDINDIEMARFDRGRERQGSAFGIGRDSVSPRNFVFVKEELAEDNTVTLWGKFCRCAMSMVGFTGVTEMMENNQNVSFTEFKPYLFRRIRISAGLTDEMYIAQFKKTIKERLTQGGSSGAFFFFSKDESLIAKSCTEEELENLTSSAQQYSDYIVDNSKSFISRIYGVYRLRIYGTSLHFFVMNNIFLNDRGHAPDRLEKYDLKGSWVARNASYPRPGDKVTCRLCQQKFIYRKKRRKLKTLLSPPATPQRSRDLTAAILATQLNPNHHENGQEILSPLQFASALSTKLMGPLSRPKSTSHLTAVSEDTDTSTPFSPDDCPVSPLRIHEAAVILKDNDLKSKLYLPPDKAREVLEQLRMDAAFLRKIKVMDYSLLMGVHYTSYNVETEDADHIPPPIERAPSARLDSLPSFNTPPSLAGSQTNSETRTRTLTAKRLTLNSPDLKRQIQLASQGQLPPGLESLEKNGHTPASPQPASQGSPYARPYEVSRVVGPDCYYMGIIDFQQQWTWGKRLERQIKILFKGADPDGLSAMPPEKYMQRFMDHMEDLLELEPGEREEEIRGQSVLHL